MTTTTNAPQANKALVLEGIKGAFVNRDTSVLDPLFSDEYKQHNPQIPNGTAAIKALLAKLPSGPAFLRRNARDAAVVPVTDKGPLGIYFPFGNDDKLQRRCAPCCCAPCLILSHSRRKTPNSGPALLDGDD